VSKGPRAWAIVDATPLRDTRLASAITDSAPFARSLKDAGVDAPHDFDRMFFSYGPTFTLIQHHIPKEQVGAFITNAMRESDPVGVETKVGVRNCHALHDKHGTGIVCVLTPTLLIIALAPKPELLDAIATSSGIELPPKGETAHASVHDPSIYEFAHLPTMLGPAEVGVVTPSTGGIRLDAVFTSTRPAEDAAALQDSLRWFDKWVHIDVTTDDAHVVASSSLSSDDADALIAVSGLARLF
jgi:hypothetical protein